MTVQKVILLQMLRHYLTGHRAQLILPAGGYYVINGFSDWISASKAIVSDTFTEDEDGNLNMDASLP